MVGRRAVEGRDRPRRRTARCALGRASAHVAAVNRDLEWEIGTGLHAEHVLRVTSAGVMDRAHRCLVRISRRPCPPLTDILPGTECGGWGSLEM